MTYDIAGAIHMHSDYSHDGLDSLEALRDACIARNIRWVGLTDHAEDFDPETFDIYRSHCAATSDDQFTFIPGLEFRFAGYRGIHLLAIGVSAWMEPHTFEDFFAQAGHAARFTVLAHPILCHYAVPQIVLDQVGAIEIWNTNYNTRYLPDPCAIELYHAAHDQRPDLLATVGLDQHDSRSDRGVRTLVSDSDMADPIAALTQGRFRTTGRSTSFDSVASITASDFRRLRLKRKLLDAAGFVHDRAIRAIRRIGVDP